MTATPAGIKKGKKFDQVLEGARAVFMRDGFEGASVDEIARAACVSKATLYSYFSDKRLLFSEVARLECNRQADAALDMIDTDAPVDQALTQAADRIVRFYLSDFGMQVYRISVAESHRFPDLGRRFYDSGPAMVRERLKFILGIYIGRGALRIADQDHAANQFNALCKTDLFVRKLCGVPRRTDDAEIARAVASVVEMFLARYGTGGRR